MFARTLAGLAGGALAALMGTSPASAQVSGRVVLDEGPIAVDIVFGPRRDAVIRHPRVVRRVEPEIVRYRPGMSLWQLERYLDRIEYEYSLYGHMSPVRAAYELGWSRAQLHTYVRWLKDERRFLRAERARLERLQRVGHRVGHRVPPGHARGHAKGHAWDVGMVASHGR